MDVLRPVRRVLVSVSVAAAVLAGASSGLIGACGPFTDVAADAFCPFVLEIFYLGITTGTTATTYDPAANVTRLQMAAFLSRTVDGVLKRGSRRATLDQFWTTQNSTVLALTTIGAGPELVKSDGADLWVASDDNTVSRVRGSDGKRLEVWTAAAAPDGVLSAMGRVFVTGYTNPGNLYRIDPSQAAGAVTTVSSGLGCNPYGIGFDGARIWTANQCGVSGSVSIVTPGATIPWSVTTVTAGFSLPTGVLFDGGNIWVTNQSSGTIVKLDSGGAVLQTVTVGSGPTIPVFDGSSIWVPNINSNSVSVFRASNGALLSTLTGNGLAAPFAAAFDGQRVLVTDYSGGVSLWKAADLTVIGTFLAGSTSAPYGACSDGVHFWITLFNDGKLARF
jgi:DNA-binding beta-propeller fold protein YncE